MLITCTALAAQGQAEAPFALRDQGQARQAGDPRAVPHLERAMIDRAELGLDDSVTFRPLNAATDSGGGVHVRLQAFKDGVRVRSSLLISHADANAVFRPHTDRLVREIKTSPELKIPLSAALARVEKRPEFTGHAQPPRGELIYFPVYERVLRATVFATAMYAHMGDHATRNDHLHGAGFVVCTRTRWAPRRSATCSGRGRRSN